MADERENTHLRGGTYPSMTQENLPPQVEAAVRLENRLTKIEAAQQALHQTMDSVLSSIGDLKGTVEARMRVIDERDERRGRELESLRDEYGKHIVEVETIGSRGRIEKLEAEVREMQQQRRVQGGHEAGVASVNKRDLAVLGVIFTAINVWLKPLAERLLGG